MASGSESELCVGVRYSYSPSFMCCDVWCSCSPSFLHLCVIKQRWFSAVVSEVFHGESAGAHSLREAARHVLVCLETIPDS